MLILSVNERISLPEATNGVPLFTLITCGHAFQNGVLFELNYVPAFSSGDCRAHFLDAVTVSVDFW